MISTFVNLLLKLYLIFAAFILHLVSWSKFEVEDKPNIVIIQIFVLGFRGPVNPWLPGGSQGAPGSENVGFPEAPRELKIDKNTKKTITKNMKNNTVFFIPF